EERAAGGPDWSHSWAKHTGAKGRIIEAAAQLMTERGYPGTSLKDIALAAGMTPGNVYNHFASKEEILFEGIFASGETLWDALSAAMARTTGAQERLLTAIGIYVSFMITPTPPLTFGPELRCIDDAAR